MKYFKLAFLGLFLFLCSFALTQRTYAAVVTWTGSGATNNWSEAANWSTVTTIPTSADVATFDATSMKSVTVDASINVSGINIAAAYLGTITQASGVTITIGSGNYSQAGGTFLGGNSTIDLNGTFSLSGTGAFTSTSSGFTVQSNWTDSATGYFTHNNGTVTFDGNPGGARTINVPGTETFYNLTLNDSGGWNDTISSGDTLVINNTLTMTQGGFSTGTLNAKGDVVMYSTMHSGSTSPLQFTGTGTQNFSMSGGSNNFYNASITVNKASGSVVQLTNVVLDSNQTFTVTDGTYNCNGFDFTVGNSDTVVDFFKITGGTFTGGSGTLAFNSRSAMNLGGGTFNATNGNMTVGAGWSNTATTFNHNNGTVIFGNAASAARTININGESFYNLTLNPLGGWTNTITSGDNIVVLNTLLLTDGAFSTGTLEARGNVTVASTYDGGTSTLTFAGTANQTFTLTGGEALFDADIIVNKTSGSVNLISGLTLNAANQDLTITSGTFDLDGQTLVVNGTSGTMVVGASGTFRLAGTETVTLNASNPTLSAGSTVYYDGGTNVTIKDYTYSNLTIGGTSGISFSLAAIETINNLTITSGNFRTVGWNFTASGTIVNNDNFVVQGGETLTFVNGFDVDSGTFVYKGDNDGISGETFTIKDNGATDFFNLTINDNNATRDIFALGANSNIAGILTVSSGTFQQSTYTLDTVGLTVSGANGTFTGGTNTITNTGALTISAGTFNSTSGTLTQSGAWTHTAGGTFTHNSGTVSFTGSAVTADVSTSETFNNLTVNKTDGQVLTIASGDSLIAVGMLNLTNGGVDTGTLEAQAGVTVGSGFDGGSSPLKFSGGSAQAFDLTGATDKFNADIEINKSGNGVTLSSALVMDASGQDLTLTLGNFSTGTNFALSASGHVTANAGTLTLNASAVDIDGNLVLGGGTVSATSGTMTVAGHLTLTSGTFTHNSGTVTLDGTNQTITGAFTFNNFTKSVTSAATLTLPASTTVTFAGALTLNGASGQVLNIRSSSSGTVASIDPQSTRTISYLDVKDNTNANATFMACRTGCVNSGNNTAWSFGSPSVTITESGGSTNTSEAGTTDTYTIVLDVVPTANVTITLTANSQVTSSTGAVIFTTANWSVAQTITVSAVDDSISEGSHTGQVTHSASSSDSGYNGISLASVSPNITDNDTAGVTVTELGGSTATSESGTTDTYTLVLTSQPTSNVTFTISADSQLTTSTGSVVFTTGNWDSAQTITVSAVDDSTVEGSHTGTLSHTTASSDSNYNAISVSSITVTITDNDSATATETISYGGGKKPQEDDDSSDEDESDDDSDSSEDESDDDDSSADEPKASFPDIVGHWAEKAIESLRSRNIVEGKSDGKFDVDAPTTRAEFLKIALLNAGYEVSVFSGSNFTDIQKRDWFYDYVSFAQYSGFIHGYQDGTFRPNDPINRAEALVLMMRISGVGISDYSSITLPFYDINTNDWFTHAIVNAHQLGLVEGYGDGSFRPAAKMSRGEMAVIAERAYELHLAEE